MRLTLVRFALLVTFLSAPAMGAIRTVTTVEDTDDGLCDAHCSLREAVATAIAGDTVRFRRELRGQEILLSRTLSIRKRLTLDGPNVRRITLKGNGTFRILEVSSVIQIDGLIISGGNAGTGDGGGINVATTLTTMSLTNVGIVDNTASRGGGIYMSGGILFIRDSTIANNTATGDSGAGGIDSSETTVRIVNSTISGNRSTSLTNGVGGLKLNRPDDWLLTNSTVAYNEALGSGNESVGGLAAIGGRPGPIYNSILARNRGRYPDFNGVSGGKSNLIGAYDLASFQNGVDGNLVGSTSNPIDPLLGPLTDNGGSLFTHTLLVTSPAINAGDTALARDRLGVPLVADQRGFSRIVGASADMGAVESDAAQLPRYSTVIGRVFDGGRRGVSQVAITMRALNGETRSAITNTFGYYKLERIPASATYEISYRLRRAELGSATILIDEALEELDPKVVERWPR